MHGISCCQRQHIIFGIISLNYNLIFELLAQTTLFTFGINGAGVRIASGDLCRKAEAPTEPAGETRRATLYACGAPS